MIKKKKIYSDSLFLILSSALSQILLVLTVPIISRIYSPNEFGIFTIFSNIAIILIPIINARYDLLIINAQSEKEANILSQISFYLSLLILVVLLPIIIIFNSLHPTFILESIVLIIFLLLVSLTNIFTNYLNREKNYKLLSLISLTRVALMVFVQVLLGYLNFGSLGLIVGFAFSYTAGISLGYNTFKKHFQKVKNHQEIKRHFVNNKDQLLFSTPSILLNSFSFSVVVFFIGYLYSNHEVGLYGMATRILGVPVTIISAALSKMFMQQANENFLKYGSFRKILINFTGLLLILSLCMYIPFYFINSRMIQFVLGKEWINTIDLLKLLIPLFMIRLIVSTISLSVIIIRKQKLELIFQGLFLIVTFITFGISYFNKFPFNNFIIFNTYGLLIAYLLFYIMIFKNSKNYNQYK